MENIEVLLQELKTELRFLKAQFANSATKYSTLSYGEWLLQWLELYKLPKCKYNYYKNLVGYVSKYLVPEFGRIKLVDIESLHLQKFLQSIPFDCTRSQLGAVLSSSLQKAYQLRLIPFNPYLAVDFKHYIPPTLGALTHSQYELVLSAINERKKYVLTFLLLATGLRQGEALALTASSFDFTAKTLRVDKSLERNTSAFVSPKTRAGVRTIPIEDKLIELLKPFIPSKGRIFCENTPDSLSRYYRRLFARLNLDFSGHIFRHTFITNCYELNIPDYVTQRWVGHSKRAQADTYLALRNSSDFMQTELVKYMLLLKSRVLPIY